MVEKRARIWIKNNEKKWSILIIEKQQNRNNHEYPLTKHLKLRLKRYEFTIKTLFFILKLVYLEEIT